MGTVSPYSNFFYNDYQVDSNQQRATAQNKLDESQKTEIRKNYIHSESIFSEVEYDFELLDRIRNDVAFKSLEKKHENQSSIKLIKEQYEKNLRLLLVNATSSNRRLDIQKYQEDLEKSLGTKAANDATILDEKEKNYCASVLEFFAKLHASFNKFMELHPGYFFEFLGTLNLYRLSYVFSKISIKNLWLYLKSINWIDKQDKLFGHFINIAMMDYPTAVFNLASVFIFLARLCIDFISICKHIFNPTIAEQGFSWMARLSIEWARRFSRMLNDIVWAVINAVTNFPIHFGIAIPVANWILAGFLFFDVILLSYLLYCEERQFKQRKSWISDQRSLMNGTKTDLSKNELEIKAKLLSDEISYNLMFKLMEKQAECMLTEKRALLGFCILASVVFIASFMCCLTIGSPLVLPIGFAMCVLAVAMILSRKEFGALIGARKIRSMDANETDEDIIKSRDNDVKQADWEFAKNFALNLFMPMIIMGLFTVHWPTAIAVIVVYLAVMNMTFKQNEPAKEIKQECPKEEETLVETYKPSCCMC